MMKRKIYSIVTNDILYDQRVRRISDSLEEEGFEVHLVGRKKLQTSTNNNRWHLLPCFFKKSKWFYLEFNIRVFFFLLIRSFDLLIANDLDTLLAVKLVSKIRRKKFVFDGHEIFTEVPELMGRPSVQKIWSRIGHWAVPSASLCLTVNGSIQNILAEKYQSEFHVVMNRPVKEIAYKKFSNRQAARMVLYQGAVNKGRGIAASIEACKDIPNVQFVIAGDGDEFNEIKASLEKTDYLDGKVTLLGKLKPKDLKELSKTATVGINVLHSESVNYQLSLANKFFDYAQAGVPSINMDFPEYKAHLDVFKVGLCIPDLKAQTIKDAIEQVLDNKVLYQEMLNACEEARKVWTWGNEAEKLANLFNQL